MRITSGIVFTLLLGMVSPVASSQVFINEFSAANYSQWAVGDYQDWIELYNSGGSAVDLSGYYLSDTENNPTKWAFPPGSSIPANGRLTILCASEEDNEMAGFLAANFRITQTRNEWVVFADPGGIIIDSFHITEPNQANHSWGRTTDGAAEWRVFTTPSPNAANLGPSFLGYAPKPELSIEAGYYPGGISLTMSSPDPGSTIRYTTNGDSPTAASAAYLAAVSVNATTVVKARSFPTDPQFLPSFIETNTYMIGADQFSMPVISVSGDLIDDLLTSAWGQPITTLEYFNASGVLLDEVEGRANEHGNDSNAYDQRGFDYIVHDEMGYSAEIDYPIFRVSDRDSYQRVVMKAAANDNYPFGDGAHVRDAYVHSLSQIAGLKLDERSYEPAIVFCNGVYWGVYEIREKVDDLDYTDHYYDQPRHYVDFLKTWGGTWEEYGSGADWYSLRNFILNNDMSVQGNYENVTAEFNTNSLIDYFILNSYVVSMDWLNWNTAWWRGRHPDGNARRWRYALWDNDATFGHYINYTGIPDTGPTADPCDPESLGDPGGQGHVPILNKLLDNEEFTNDYVNRWADLSNSVFSCDFMIHHLDSLIAIIEPEMPRQIQRWGGSLSGWQNRVQELRNFIMARCNDEIVQGMEECYDLESITITIIIEGMGQVELNTITITIPMTPWDGIYYAGIPIELDAIEIPGGFFIEWEVVDGNLIINDPSNPSIVITPDGDVTIIAHFVETLGPFAIMYDVQPEGAGEILVNNFPAGPYPNTVLHDINADVDLEAIPNEWFVFDHWESLNHSFTPNELSNPAGIQYTRSDTVIAVFTELEHYTITLDVFPVGAGTASINGFTPGALPYTTVLPGSEDISFATVSSGEWFQFSHWEVNNNVVIPADNLPEILLNLSANDTIVAVYNEIPHFEITVIVEPPYSGLVQFGDGPAIDYIWTGILEGAIPTEFTATPSEFFIFKSWEARYHSILPTLLDKEVQISFNQNDTIIAHFEPEEFSFYIPNSFSPNNDGENDVFLPIGEAFEPTGYELRIFNRWGELVFESDDPFKPWDGSHREGEFYVKDEVYNYLLTVKPVNEISPRRYSGHIFVFR
jgi:gliding motility-associated-like protein